MSESCHCLQEKFIRTYQNTMFVSLHARISIKLPVILGINLICLIFQYHFIHTIELFQHKPPPLKFESTPQSASSPSHRGWCSWVSQGTEQLYIGRYGFWQFLSKSNSLTLWHKTMINYVYVYRSIYTYHYIYKLIYIYWNIYWNITKTPKVSRCHCPFNLPVLHLNEQVLGNGRTTLHWCISSCCMLLHDIHGVISPTFNHQKRKNRSNCDRKFSLWLNKWLNKANFAPRSPRWWRCVVRSLYRLWCCQHSWWICESGKSKDICIDVYVGDVSVLCPIYIYIYIQYILLYIYDHTYLYIYIYHIIVD